MVQTSLLNGHRLHVWLLSYQMLQRGRKALSV